MVFQSPSCVQAGKLEWLPAFGQARTSTPCSQLRHTAVSKPEGLNMCQWAPRVTWPLTAIGTILCRIGTVALHGEMVEVG